MTCVTGARGAPARCVGGAPRPCRALARRSVTLRLSQRRRPHLCNCLYHQGTVGASHKTQFQEWPFARVSLSGEIALPGTGERRIHAAIVRALRWAPGLGISKEIDHLDAENPKNSQGRAGRARLRRLMVARLRRAQKRLIFLPHCRC
jgi:hypothetical protein